LKNKLDAESADKEKALQESKEVQSIVSNLRHQTLAFALQKGKAANHAKAAASEQARLEASLKESTEKLANLSQNKESSAQETEKAS